MSHDQEANEGSFKGTAETSERKGREQANTPVGTSEVGNPFTVLFAWMWVCERVK